MQGTIKKIIAHRGYGFIETDERDEDIFFHRTKVKSDFDFLREGDTVEFEVEETFKGPQALDLVVVE